MSGVYPGRSGLGLAGGGLDGLATATDPELVARCRAGEQPAWGELVERFSRYIYAIAIQVYRLSEPDSEDVFQEVFTRAYERLDELRDPSALKSWLAQMARRLCLDRLRAGARERPSEELPESAADDEMTRLDEALVVRDALAVLPENYQETVDRFFARDQSYKTISEALDIPPGTVASRISRGLVKLRIELEGR